MSDTQAWDLSEIVLSEYSNLKIPDFKKCFNNAILGKYGQLFNRLDGQIICLWLNQYCKDQDEEIMNFRMAEASKYKNEAKTLPPVLLKVAKKIVSDNKNVGQKVRVRTENELMMDRWINQFDTIYAKRGISDGLKFVFRYGRHLSMDEFLNVKLEQYNRVIKQLNQ